MEKASQELKALRVMFQDEARFGRISSPKACWAPLGMRPEAKAQIVRQYLHVFGAVSPKDGKHDSLVLPYADTDAMSIFLREAAKRHPKEHILMFMDQAAWHKAKALKIPLSMELSFLPPYSPEVNPQEQVWDELKEKFFGNGLFKSIKAVEKRVIEGLRHIEARPEALMSLTQRSWM
jgi:transposase